MDLSTQPLFQSPTADRLLFARDLRADRATLVSGHRNSFPISASFASSEPLLHFPILFAKNVLAYGSYWGIWGITYLFRLTGLHDFSRLSFFDLEPAQNIIITVLKVIIIGAALWIAWHNRHARGR